MPILTLAVFGGLDGRERSRETAAAAAVERQVDRADRALEVYLRITAEEHMSEALVLSAPFGISPQQAGDLLGIDLLAELQRARTALDEATGAGVPGLTAIRAGIDAGTVAPERVQGFFSQVNDEAEEAYLEEMALLGTIAFETHGSGAVRQAAAGLVTAAEVFSHVSTQNTAAARMLVAGLTEVPAAREELVLANLLFARAAAKVEDELTPAAREVWRRVRGDRGVRAFERFVDEVAASVGPPVELDIARMAEVFGAGLRREHRLEEVVVAQAAGVVELARDLQADARREQRDQLWILGVLIALSVAATAATARSIVVPLRRLARRAVEVSGGHIEGKPLDRSGPAEVAVVTDAFNESVANLRSVAAQASALAAADFAHPSLAAPVPGLIGEGLRNSVERLSRSMRDNEELRRSLARKATHDPLTGLPNRLLLLDRLEHALARADRVPGSLAVVFIDIDQFKVVNDAKGHTAGDQLLVDVAQRIRGSVRSGDTVARFGGDEFVVVLEGIDGAESAAAICEGIRGNLEAPFLIDGSDLVVTVSQGIAVAAPGDTAEDLLRAADAAMYSAKEGGRARTEVADQATRSRAVHRLQIEADMRRGLDAGEFVVHFQPVVALGDGSIVGAEALVRWQDPERGLVRPDLFIPMAEETGLIVPLGEQVLRQALEEAARWPAVHPGGSAPSISVNVSGRQFVVPGFAEVIARVVAESGIEPDRVHLELTESILMRDVDRSTSTLEAIVAQGVHISIDDFGTGYSSLGYVHRLPIDTLKIDKSFVDLLEPNGRDTSIVAAVIDMSRALGIVVVAEGVETAAQGAELERLGCRYAQGYHFARPMPAADLAALLTTRGELAISLPAGR